MHRYATFAVNVMLSGLAGYVMADAAAIHALAPLYYECTGVIGGLLAGAAGWL